MTKAIETAIRRAIERAPVSLRDLAREAGVSHVMLHGIETEKEGATLRVGVKVARALERWAQLLDRDARDCGKEAARLRAAIKVHQKGGKR